MDRLLHMDVQVRERVYTKDPSSTELGHRIIGTGLQLIDELGFEAFTMAKLAKSLGTAEASVYRYFANKHRLLVYLVDWYWAWRESKLAFLYTGQGSQYVNMLRALAGVKERELLSRTAAHEDALLADRKSVV